MNNLLACRSQRAVSQRIFFINFATDFVVVFFYVPVAREFFFSSHLIVLLAKHPPPSTTKKGDYPSILKSVGIAPKSAGIGSKFLSRRFFSRRIRPPLFECGDGLCGPIPALSNPVPAFLKALGQPL